MTAFSKTLPTKIEYLPDTTGIKRAYNATSKNYVFGNTLYVAGTSNWYDVFCDLMIPLHLLNCTTRYQISEDIINNNSNITRVVGHSLGGAITHNLIRDHSSLHEGIALGSPNILTNSYGNRLKYFRHIGDPVSICNIHSASLEEDVEFTLNPHTYNLYEDCLGHATKMTFNIHHVKKY